MRFANHIVRAGSVFALAVLLCLSFRLAAVAAEPVLTIVVAYAAGGSTDAIARIFAVRLQEKLGRAVVVENKAGATGQIGSRFVAKAAPDGNTIQFAAQTTHAVAPSLYGPVIGYEPLKDFTPIILVAWTPLVLAANPSFPPNNVQELVAYLKSRPGEVSYATGGRGDGSHLSALLFHKLTGVQSVAVPFNGEGQALPQLLGNHVSYMFMGAPVASQPVASGDLKALAVTSKQRSSLLPNVPTVQESGVKDLEVVNWWGVFGPAGIPVEKVNQLNKAIGEIIQEPDTRAKLKALGFELTGSTPEEFKAYLESETARWADIIKGEGLAPQQN
ncbi:MAG: tripartite tricarboxylate transporter substrate binding protein [Bradyrhizobium sp.]